MTAEVNVERMPSASGGSYSDGVIVRAQEGGWIFVSGQLPFAEGGTVLRGDLGEQATSCFEHIERVLATYGAKREHIVKITAFIINVEDYAQYAKARAEFFGETLPASSAVEVTGLLEGAELEVEALAFKPT